MRLNENYEVYTVLLISISVLLFTYPGYFMKFFEHSWLMNKLQLIINNFRFFFQNTICGWLFMDFSPF